MKIPQLQIAPTVQRRQSHRALALAACTFLLASCSSAQTQPANPQPANPPTASPQPVKPLLSPPETADVTLAGKTITLKYNAPSLRGRSLDAILHYDQVWRTGANAATTLTTPVPLHLGTLLVPAGTYTIFSVPSKKRWTLIVNRQTGQWGTIYHLEEDLGRIEMKSALLPAPQERMSLSFEHVRKHSAELHLRWDNVDESVRITAP